MSAPPEPTPLGGSTATLTDEEARWLHDKFERLSSEEVDLSGSRTSYFAAIGTVLITGAVVATVNLLGQPLLLTAMVTFLAALGALISFVWVVLLHRTNDAQALWREAALRLEALRPPIAGELRAPVTLRSGRSLEVDLLRPYTVHAGRFSPSNPISWLDRVNPARLTEILPMTFIGLWIGVLVVVWAWYLVLR